MYNFSVTLFIRISISSKSIYLQKNFYSYRIHQRASLVRKSLLLIVVLLGWFLAFTQPPQLKFLHLNTEHGLPDGTVRSITQDKYGYIWLGTQYGLCRYNGYGLTFFTGSPTQLQLQEILSGAVSRIRMEMYGQVTIAFK